MEGVAPSLVSRRTEEEIIAALKVGGPALVALSGGVDSSVVAALAFEALDDSALAVTLAGPAVSREEVIRARTVAAFLGIEHRVVTVDPVAREEYRANTANRCYHCRSVESAALRTVGEPRGVRQYLDGIHVDDFSDDRPGVRAMDEAGFRHPLAWAGWTKADIRSAARARKLPNWDWPSDACLASRVAHGDPISRDLLRQVEAAEITLLDRGFRRVRVRVRGGAARIEVDPQEVPRLLSEPLATEVLAAVRAIGFDPVTIDRDGYGHHRPPAESTP